MSSKVNVKGPNKRKRGASDEEEGGGSSSSSSSSSSRGRARGVPIGSSSGGGSSSSSSSGSNSNSGNSATKEDYNDLLNIFTAKLGPSSLSSDAEAVSSALKSIAAYVQTAKGLFYDSQQVLAVLAELIQYNGKL